MKTIADETASAQELAEFARLQDSLVTQFRDVFPDPDLPRTIVVVPSLTLDQQVLDKIAGAPFYEERLLCLLMLLRMPRTRVIYVTSVAVHPTIVDYYLNLLAGIPSAHVRRRLVFINCHDDSSKPLTQKLLERPRLLARIRSEIPNVASAHLTCFASTALERSLALRLDIPLYACDPARSHLGDKSHGREIMRRAEVPIAAGYEHLRDSDDMIDALCRLKREHGDLRRAVVKLNEGFSGEGNAIFSFADAPSGADLLPWLRETVPARLAFEAKDMSWEAFAAKFAEMRGIVECFIEGEDKRSPNARYRIDPLGRVETISVQDQVLGGPSGQIYLACRFPAAAGYRLEVQEMGRRISEVLRDEGIIGQVGHDFICVRDGDAWQVYGIEVNIRKGGATHPFLMLQYLTDGHYSEETATFGTPAGESRCYIASDNVEDQRYRGLTPDDLVDIAVENRIHFSEATQTGVVFHLIGALSRFGKLGMVCIDKTAAGAERRYQQTRDILDREATD